MKLETIENKINKLEDRMQRLADAAFWSEGDEKKQELIHKQFCLLHTKKEDLEAKWDEEYIKSI